MISAGVLGSLFLLALTVLAGVTLVVVVRGGRGAGDPPASRLRVDPNGFPVLSRPRRPGPRGPGRSRP